MHRSDYNFFVLFDTSTPTFAMRYTSSTYSYYYYIDKVIIVCLVLIHSYIIYTLVF